jgi:hypothetical protein
MAYQGDYAPASTVSFTFTTINVGAPTTLAGTPAISVYKGSNTAESTTGVSLTADYDSRTGLNLVSIDTSADGTFYAAGNDFNCVITTGTVGGNSVVGYTIGSFSLNNRSPLRPATAGRTLLVDSSGGVTLTTSQLFIKKNIAVVFPFVMLDSTTRLPKTGLTVTATRSLDGAAFGACANAVAEISSGWYKITLATTDTNATVIALRLAATGAVDTDLTIYTQP